MVLLKKKKQPISMNPKKQVPILKPPLQPLRPFEPPIIGRPVTQPMGAQPQTPFKPPPTIDPRKNLGLQPLQPSNPIVGRPVQPMAKPPQEALAIMHQNRPKPNDVDPKRNSLIQNPIVGRPVTSTMGGGGEVQPPSGIGAPGISSAVMASLNGKANPGVRKLLDSPVSGQPVSAMGGISQANIMSLSSPSAQPMMQQMQQQYSATAASAQPPTNYATTASTPTASATMSAPNANVQAAINGMSDALKKEIKRKALAGEPMESTTEAKRWLYNSYKTQGTGTTTPPGTTQPGTTQPPAYKPIVAPPVNNGQANWNSNQSIPDYGAMTPGMIEALQNGYLNNPAYDPATDPAYQASLALANKQADAAGLSTMEDMNERGILNSTVTSDRVGQIKQGASDAVIGNIPGLQANYYNNHHNNMNGLSNLLNTTIGAGQWQQTHAQENYEFDKGFSLDEAQVTGQYMPAEAKGIVDKIMTAKKANTVPGLSDKERQENARVANEGRQQLASMGIDISGIGGDVTYDDAIRNLPNLGRSTIIQQQTDLDKTEVMGRQVDSKAQGLIQQILQAKGNNEKGIGNKAANARVADNARAQLSALGFDISGIGGNVKYAQAVKNAENIMGKNTLGRDTLNSDHTLAGKELQLERDRLNSDDALGNRELAFREEEAKIQAHLESRGLDLEDVRNGIDAFTAESDAEYKARQTENDLTANEAKINTNRAIGHIAGAQSAGEAWAYIHSQTQAWADMGVDFNDVVDALESKFPGSTKKSSSESEDEGSTSGFFDTP